MATAWANCMKNPGHEDFIPVRDFAGANLSHPLGEEDLRMLRVTADLTVRMRVTLTSWGRPDTDQLSAYRGSRHLRIGTGFIKDVHFETNKPCPCDKCDGYVVRNHWVFNVQTARHVVYNTEEALRTRVDLFYDDEISKHDGRMVTIWASRVAMVSSDRDVCDVECVTHDGDIGQKIQFLCSNLPRSRPSHYRKQLDLPDYPSMAWAGFVPRSYVLIISHPHGQPKKITVGYASRGTNLTTDVCANYHAATCQGSSGAPVFSIVGDYLDASWNIHCIGHNLQRFVHSGSFDKTFLTKKYQVNYGFFKL